ncbi:achaete-scute homolog 5 [Ornithorhynchus anatinus]|uniref:Achaete-scute family bHLH transcription factor 5 n=1 Tax=Ornithorhynchus anatinus TaxID=9258 RepID=A0A6I8P5G0_ORNAN|nr:achaete-scute homolog 5 [Ornithorhynchus anatinus]
MNNNLCRALVERRSVATSSCMQLGLAPPPSLPHLPPAEALTNVPFLLYPANVEHTYYDAYGNGFPYVPFHGPFGIYDYPFEPAFIQKRNERERQRVKCVNEGYARLRGHLPGTVSEKRLSKVETLRAAVRYIKYLQDLLNRASEGPVADTTDGSTPRSPTLRPPPAPTSDCPSDDGEAKVSSSSAPESSSPSRFSSSPFCESEEPSR